MGSKQPKPPNPKKVAAAQFDYSTGAGLASGIINNPNISNPYGEISYTQSGTESIQLPNGQTVQIPRYTQTTTPNAQSQKQIDSRNAMINQLMGTASQRFGQDPTKGAPAWQTSYGTGQLKDDFQGNANTLGFTGIDTGGFDSEGGFSADRRRVEEAMMSRGGELLGKNRDSEVARLSAMGLAPGSEKYGRVSDQFERSGNDLAMQSILAGGQEQSRLLGETRSTAQLKMARTQMENARRTGDMEAYNAAKQMYNNAQIAQTQMNRDQAMFGNSTRGQMISEMTGLQGQALNQLMALLQGQQYQNPNAPGFQGQGVQAPDYAGLMGQNYQNQVGAYNAKMAGYADMAKAVTGMLPW